MTEHRPVAGCPHERTHVHGTAAAYNRCGCRCEECRRAVAAAARKRRARGSAKVPARQVAEAIDRLIASGMNEARVGEGLGVSAARVLELRRWRDQPQRYASTWSKVAALEREAGEVVRPVMSLDDTRADTVACLLHEALDAGMTMNQVSRAMGLDAKVVDRMVDPPVASLHRDEDVVVRARRVAALARSGRRPAGGMVPATLAARRLQALAAMGWGAPSVARVSGLSLSDVKEVRSGARDLVTDATHQAVASAWRELVRTPAPDGNASTLSRRAAALAGWAPPMAWDNERDMADPDAVPDTTSVAPYVSPTDAGRRRARRRRAERERAQS